MYDSTERYPRTVQKFKSDKYKLSIHPTQKPVELFEYFIKTYSNEGDEVIDFCFGSGSSGEACVNLDRNYTGIEKEKKYFDSGKKRILNAAKEKLAA